MMVTNAFHENLKSKKIIAELNAKQNKMILVVFSKKLKFTGNMVNENWKNYIVLHKWNII